MTEERSHRAEPGWMLEQRSLIALKQQTGGISLLKPRQLRSKLAGSYQSKARGRGMEYAETRHYQPGDDIRSIDWRVTARTGKAHTKLFHEERERPVFLLVDLGASMRFGSQWRFKSVQAAHLAAQLAWCACDNGDRIGGLIWNQYQHQELKPKSRSAAVLHLIHTMVSLHEQTPQHGIEPQDFNHALSRLRYIVRPGSQVILISDFQQLNDEGIRHLSLLGRHNDLIAGEIYDPLEIQLPETEFGNDLMITDGNQRAILPLSQRNQRQQCQQRLEQARQSRLDQLQKSGCRLFHIGAHEEINKQWRRQHHGR
ncbi:DUF58 domain-containing protein [Corallincola spongiicola]|uniref:DUF58 domain-containing protein n=1 Tax=Corallincola spongiicola TaxID=2520508 RepID=A0ABY1WMZ4_9GAMM|nr:DUF58 domain-containing protein [Corallincola spongiicola]TAA43794.1 DUF58 domain-containing protein [Corallincola spongiicola]